jgi:GNAT superfamily N-acetyltransferase
MQVEIGPHRFADLGEVEREEVRALTLAVYPPEDSANWHGREIDWAEPEWCVRIRDGEGALLSYTGVYVREGTWDGRAVRIGGIGNVKTHPAARRQGLAALGIAQAFRFFREQGLDFGLLVCEPHLTEYYSRLGWREFAGKLLIRQRGKWAEFVLNRVMVLPILCEAPGTGTLDLCGPPW